MKKIGKLMLFLSIIAASSTAFSMVPKTCWECEAGQACKQVKCDCGKWVCPD